MINPLLILLGVGAGFAITLGSVLAGLPWLAQLVFKRRSGLWVARAEMLAIGALVPFWIYLWVTECLNCVKCKIEGDQLIDNDSTCRALFFGLLPFVILTVTIGLSAILLSSNRLSKQYRPNTPLEQSA